ncbi:MAG: N-acetyltransferase [Acetobacteraceae bacterium]|nr:N-acetyltransferase [Acetobacteraceae bacterium]
MPDLNNNTSHHRYEMDVDGHIAFVDYRTEAGRLVLMHTEVPKALSGRGIGSQLARAVLEDARQRNQPIVAECEFLAGYIAKHPEFAPLLGKC